MAGQGNVSHSGESNAWGSGATVHKSVGGKARKDEAKAAAAAKKNAKDEWQTTGTSKKGSTKNTAKQASGGSGAAGSGGSKAAGTPQPQPTKVCFDYSSPVVVLKYIPFLCRKTIHKLPNTEQCLQLDSERRQKEEEEGQEGEEAQGQG